MRAMSPVGVPPPDLAATVTLKFTVAPWVMVTGVRVVKVVVLAAKVAVLHPLTRLAALTEPRPVAIS